MGKSLEGRQTGKRERVERKEREKERERGGGREREREGGRGRESTHKLIAL